MRFNTRMIGAGVAAGVAAALGYALLARDDDETAFETVRRDGAFSVRDYPRLLVAETVVEGTRDAALSCGFTTLADFVADRRMPLSAPVLRDGDEDGRGWRTRLVLPMRAAPDALPRPAGPVTLRALPARRLAAFRFAGDNDEDVLLGREADLRDWIAEHGLSAAGPVEHAFYHSPLTPRALRRTEVLIPLAA